ncbi:hypothetical protein [Butyrivibrio sp. FC2001]|uniref:hypothetical protein n=1 Tax=Butyrivibrio sp. FC2001 TaxID=1280671 RepID=UPI00042344F4|nr:hypothetical protein [Butyrivibrio sp. FC2001]
MKICKSITNQVLIVMMGVYLFYCSTQITTFNFVYPSSLENKILKVMMLLVIFKVILNFRDKNLIPAIGVALVYFLSWKEVRYSFLIFLALITIGCVGVNYKRILKCYLVVIASVIILAVSASLCGTISNLVFPVANGNIRSSWGICYPTDFASIIVYLIMVAFSLLLTVPASFFFIPIILGMGISIFITRSITSSVCLLLFSIAVIYMTLYEKTEDNHSIHQKYMKICKGMLIGVFPICALFVFGLIFLGYSGYISVSDFNRYTHNRLGLSIDALNNYGIKPFGTAFDLIGWGFSTVKDTRYNFIDSSYPLILIRYGWITFVVISILWIYMMVKVIKAGNMRLAFVMAIIAVHSISEHHFPEINYNIFLVLPFADYGKTEYNSAVSLSVWWGEGKNRKKKQIFAVYIAIAIMICALAIPYAISWLRTAFIGYSYINGGNKVIKVILFLFVIFVSVILLIVSFGKVLTEYLDGKIIYRKYIALSLVSVMLLFAAASKTVAMVDRISGWMTTRIDDNYDAIALIQNNSLGKFYVDKYPEVYGRKIKNISRSFFNGEDLARYKNVTVLVDRNFDSNCFFKAGFLYMPISDTDAIYTNDIGVINAFENKGNHMTNFFSDIQNVSLDNLSVLNELPMTENGELLMEGQDHSLIHGPYIDMSKGDYTATYKLKINPLPYKTNYEVAEIKINTYWGQNTISQKDIFRSDFDEKGELSLELPFKITSGKAVEFLAIVQGENQVVISSIEYKRLQK